MIRVFVADDHELVREGLARLLRDAGDIEIVGQAGTAAEVIARCQVEQWDVLVLDLSFPDGNGLDVLTAVHAHKPKLPVLVLSMHAEDLYALRVLSAGAAGYLTKGRPSSMLVEAVQKLARGGRYITPELAEMLLVSPTARDQPLHQTLSERQFQILVLIGEGKTPSDVAYAIGVQASTVSSHLLQIKQRLGLRSNGELAQYALQAGLVGPTGQLK